MRSKRRENKVVFGCSSSEGGSGGSSSSSSGSGGGSQFLTASSGACFALASDSGGGVVQTHKVMVEGALPAEGACAVLVMTSVGLFVAVDAEVAFEVVLAVELLFATGEVAGVHDAHG